MTLPPAALQQLAAPLRDTPPFYRPIRSEHTLPVGQWAWDQHSAALKAALESLADTPTFAPSDFVTTRDWVDQLLAARHSTLAHLLALEPFTPFDTARGEEVVTLVDVLVTEAADAVIAARTTAVPANELRDAGTWWTTRKALADGHEPLRVAFNLPEAPIDEGGEFRAEWVLQHYAYRGGDLLVEIFPHLVALGVPAATDVLAAVSVVGSLLDCDDPVAAYVALDGFVSAHLAADPAIQAAVSGHLASREPALKNARLATNRAWITAADRDRTPTEERALNLVDAYTRLVEGPFRQLSWALYSLRRGLWEPPPMLTSLRERLVAAGGNLGALAGDVILTDLRNSKTHETLVWDGFAEEFVTEEGRIQPSTVALAFTLADSFAHGCEAGLAAVRALQLDLADEAHPHPQELGRMPTWRRVHAFFGTNRLRLLDAQLNTRHATLTVGRLAVTDINPCFQALTLAHRLLPDIETYSVGTPSSGGAVITVSTHALEAAMATWEFAVKSLDQIPLSTFLPINLDARRRVEDSATAVRSVAWIACDDAVGIIDGAPPPWDAETRRLLATRLQIVEMSAESAESLLIGVPVVRLRSVRASANAMRQLLDKAAESWAIIDSAELEKLRLQWDAWGPAVRHPLVAEDEAPDLSESQPMLRIESDSLHFRTL